MSKLISLRIPDTLLSKIDSERGLVSRSLIIKNILQYVSDQDMIESFSKQK